MQVLGIIPPFYVTIFCFRGEENLKSKYKYCYIFPPTSKTLLKMVLTAII